MVLYGCCLWLCRSYTLRGHYHARVYINGLCSNHGASFLVSQCLVHSHSSRNTWMNEWRRKRQQQTELNVPEMGFPSGAVVKNPPANAGEAGSIPGLGTSPEEGNGNPFQYSCLGNPMDRRAWLATVHGVAKSWTWLSSHTQMFPSERFKSQGSNENSDRFCCRKIKTMLSLVPVMKCTCQPTWNVLFNYQKITFHHVNRLKRWFLQGHHSSQTLPTARWPCA